MDKNDIVNLTGLILLAAPLIFTIYKILSKKFVDKWLIILSTISAAFLFSLLSVIILIFFKSTRFNFQPYIAVFVILTTYGINRWMRTTNNKLKQN